MRKLNYKEQKVVSCFEVTTGQEVVGSAWETLVPAAKIQPRILVIISRSKKLQLVICGIGNNLDVQY